MAVLLERECEEFGHFCQSTTSFEVLFFEFSILENQKKGGKWVGKIEFSPRGMFLVIKRQSAGG